MLFYSSVLSLDVCYQSIFMLLHQIFEMILIFSYLGVKSGIGPILKLIKMVLECQDI